MRYNMHKMHNAHTTHKRIYPQQTPNITPNNINTINLFPKNDGRRIRQAVKGIEMEGYRVYLLIIAFCCAIAGYFLSLVIKEEKNKQASEGNCGSAVHWFLEWPFGCNAVSFKQWADYCKNQDGFFYIPENYRSCRIYGTFNSSCKERKCSVILWCDGA